MATLKVALVEPVKVDVDNLVTEHQVLAATVLSAHTNRKNTSKRFQSTIVISPV